MTVLRVIDFETTGEHPPAEVIEVGRCDLDLATGNVSIPRWWFYHAAVIPPETRAIHHITAEDLVGSPPFDPSALMAEAVADEVGAIVGHNVAFELQWIEPPVPVICTFKAALRVWPDAPSHGNQALRYWLEDLGLIKVDRIAATPAHRAGPDAYVTALILKALLATGVTGKTMTGWTKLPALQPRMKFGKHKGAAWPDVPRDYLEWVLKSDLDEDTKWNSRRELDRRDGRVA